MGTGPSPVASAETCASPPVPLLTSDAFAAAAVPLLTAGEGGAAFLLLTAGEHCRLGRQVRFCDI